MDGIKNKPFSAPPEAPQPLKQKLSGPYIPRTEELFISREETKEHEKKFRAGILAKKIIFSILGLAAAMAIAYAAYFFWKTYSVGKQMNAGNSSRMTLSGYVRAIASPVIPLHQDPLRGEETGRVNILLLGAAGEHKPGGNLTDTVMVASIDTKNKKVALLSLPRDLYVQIPASTRGDNSSTRGGPDTQSYTKINSLYPIGIKAGNGADLIKQAVEKITGLTLNYYLAIDFDGFQKVIDAIGGINVTSERDIYDARFPGPNYSYETFSLTKGFHVFNGATALKYVRERHDDPEGDFGRAKRQQQVIQAMKNKLFSVKTFFNVVALNDILGALGESVRTDIAFGDIDRFISLSKEVDMQNITNVVADAWQSGSLLKVSHVTVGSVQAFILVPRVGNYSEIQDLAQNIFNQNELKKRQDAIVAEKARIAIVNRSGNNQLASKIQKLLTDKLDMGSVRIAAKTTGPIAQQTTVTDNSNGAKLFTLDELVKKLPATVADQSMATGATSTGDDIMITLGSDLVDVYKYEENTMQDLLNSENDNVGYNTNQ
jgi:LCP family protein required for cell wall assembly